MALTLDIGANTRAAVANVKDLGAALEGVSDSMDDLAREAQRRGSATETAIGGIGSAGRAAGADIESAGDKIERTFRDMVNDAKRADRAVSDIGDNGPRSLARVRDGAQEVTQEVGQNLGEAVSSIRGDFSDLGQVGQDTLGGLAATLAGAGPVGILGAAALAAGAIGLGAITAELQKQQEEADRMRDRLSSAYQSASEDGRAYLDTAQLISEAHDLAFNPDRADEWKRVQEDAKRLGMDNADVIAANAGDLSKQAEVQERINALIDEQNNKPRQNGFMGTAEWDEQMKALRDVRDRWQAVSDVTQQNVEKVAAIKQVVSDYKAAQDDAAKSVVDGAGRQLEAVQRLHAEAAKTVEATVKFKVDDSEVRAYRVPQKVGVATYKAAQTAWD